MDDQLYACTACDVVVAERSYSPPEDDCPVCGNDEYRRLKR